MISKYVDIPSIMQVIGCVYVKPSILDTEGKYSFSEEDFTEDFHKILFGSIYNLHNLGAKDININVIEDYLRQRPSKFAIYKTNKGAEYLLKISQRVQLSAFDYYYNRMKKMTLLRLYNTKVGMDLSWLYDVDNILDTKKKQLQEDWLDNTSIDVIADTIDKKIEQIKIQYVTGTNPITNQAGEGLNELVRSFQEAPDIGIPLYGEMNNTVSRGARLGKLYLRSASTGIGKTRSMIADACMFSCSEIYNINNNSWEFIGSNQPTLYIPTEQDLGEVQTMILAFVSGVEESHILLNNYQGNEWERIQKAIQIIKNAPLYVAELPDFSLQDIENIIKNEIFTHNVIYICYDYLHTSIKILSEISMKAGIKGLREDNILFLISAKLKEIAVKYNVFIETSTQVNREYKTATILDQSLLRGAQSIGDSIDLGEIMLEVTETDLEALQPIISKNGLPSPVIKTAVYKNRRSQYKNIILWCNDNRGTCRIDPIFATNNKYELISLDNLKIEIVKSQEESAF